jgi:hypothetical protein
MSDHCIPKARFDADFVDTVIAVAVLRRVREPR